MILLSAEQTERGTAGNSAKSETEVIWPDAKNEDKMKIVAGINFFKAIFDK